MFSADNKCEICERAFVFSAKRRLATCSAVYREMMLTDQVK